jgi:hypothetical protein
VLEVPDVTVKLSSGRRNWTYGTVGVGVEYVPAIWKEHEHVFSAQTQRLTHKTPIQAINLGRPNRLKSTFLNDHPVDCLLVDGESDTRWVPWISSTQEANRPQAILSFLDKTSLDDEDGPISKTQRKVLTKLGYDVRYWYLKAWEFGAALKLSTVCMIWYRTEDSTATLPTPRNSALPVRPMSNLLKPFGIPSKAWARKQPEPLHGQTHRGPCHINGHINGELVFNELGAMPNEIGSWISTGKGTRRLQYEELAKAKGINDLVTNCDDKSVRSAIKNGVGIHLWSASLDALGLWMRGPDDDNVTASTVEDEDFPQWEDESESESNEEWTWEPPDLREEQPWFRERVESLRQAVAKFSRPLGFGPSPPKLLR